LRSDGQANGARRREPLERIYDAQDHPRRRVPTPFVRVTRASAALIVIALGMGLALAAAIGLGIYLIATIIHHAASS
jgi:hypothetical protein